MDRTVQDYLVRLRNEKLSESEKKIRVQWIHDFVSMALSSIGSQVIEMISMMPILYVIGMGLIAGCAGRNVVRAIV